MYKSLFLEDNTNEEIEIFKKENPNIKPIKFPISLLKKDIENWNIHTRDFYKREKEKVNNLKKINPKKYLPIIIHKYGKKYKIIDGWHRTSAVNDLNIKYIMAYIKKY